MSAPAFSPDQMQQSFGSHQESAEEFVPQPHTEYLRHDVPTAPGSINMADFEAAMGRAHDALHAEGPEGDTASGEKLPPGVAERLGDLASRGVDIESALDPTGQEMTRATTLEQPTSQSDITSRLG